MVICQAESISTSLFFEELATIINGYLSSWIYFNFSFFLKN
jgi:hypothetical protein